jgi:ABC-type multidrug transport system ATPase subunit
LARAVYQDREIYLLDDCLTHLDVLAGDYVFEKSIKQFLKHKLVVLVTQNPKHVSRADGVIVLKNQTVKFVQQEDVVEELQNVTISWKKDEIKLPSGNILFEDWKSFKAIGNFEYVLVAATAAHCSFIGDVKQQKDYRQ